jgi:hypothetical protein
VKSQDKLQQNLTSIKEKVQEVKIDNNTFTQSIDIMDKSKGKISFISVVDDGKGKISKESFEFYLSDIDPNTIIRKTSGKKLFVSLTINNNQKFIKHFTEDKLDGYTSSLEILFSGADAAQEIIGLFKSSIPMAIPGKIVWNTNKDALNWLKSNITNVNSDQSNVEQSFSFGERKDYLASLTVKKTDQKGNSNEEKYEFSILDINKKELVVKISGTQLLVSVETSGKDRYIKYYKNNEQGSFGNAFEISASDIDQARNIIAAFSIAIEKSKPTIPDFSTLQSWLDYITKNTTDLNLENKKLNQKITFTPDNGTKSIFVYAEPDSKGKLIEERYEFYLNDIDGSNLNFKVSGAKISVVPVSKNNTKFIKYYKDNIQQDFQDEVSIITNDIETSREMLEAFKEAIKRSQVQPATWKNVDEAIAYLTKTMTGETVGADLYKLNFSSIAADPLNVRYMLDKTDVKAITVKQSYEFYPYMLDPGTVKISAAGKYLVVSASVNNKKPYVKVYKDDIQQSFDDNIAFMAFDSRQAREIADAIKYVLSNVKAKNMVWADKNSAMKYITENVSDLKSATKEIKQKVTFDDPCKISLAISSTDDKGKTLDETYEFALTDMNKQMIDYKTSGKNVLITLTCKNKEKLVKAYKNGVQQAWTTSVEIEATDVETARNISEAFRFAITQCEK